MNIDLSAEQHTLVESFTSLYADTCPPSRVRAAEPSGFDADLWERVRAAGAVTMAVEEAQGGWGAELVDLALVAEVHGRFLVPVPTLELQVAARLLARLRSARGSAVLAEVLAEERAVTIAVRPVLGGLASLVPAGAVVDDVLVLDGGRLLLAPCAGGVRIDNLGSLALADVVIGADAEVLAEGPGAVAAHDSALDELLLLTAAAQVGIAARALEIGVEYVRGRHAFGVPIGAFQSVAHPLADAAAAIDGARLLTYEGAWARAEDPARFAELAALGFAFATETARDTTAKSLHFHGGYGFTEEYDIQLYYRRARAWGAVLLDPRAAYRRAADRRLGTDEAPAHEEAAWTSV